MSKRKYSPASDYIVPLNINDLQGRMLKAPSTSMKKREILMIYGHHSSLERMIGFAEELRRYGNVTMPDLPGFGGMDSLYSVKSKPTLDNLADYLAAFVKLRYKRKRLTIIGMSFGFLIATKMLQKYPDIAQKVDLVISVVGFVHHEDFILPNKIKLPLRVMASIFSRKVPAWFMQNFILNAPVIRLTYKLGGDKNSKLKGFNEQERKKLVDFEIILWKINDIRTYMDTTVTMFRANVCDTQIGSPVHHVAAEVDRYFDNHRVEQHLEIIYEAVYVIPVNSKVHAPTVVATPKEAAEFIPTKLRRLLSKQP